MHSSDLKLSGCTYSAALHACRTWHYSRCIPAGKTVKFGVWEFERFIGVVIFSHGATQRLLRPYKLTQYQGCELTRIALTTHRTPVSRIVAVAMRLLQKQCPGLRLVVSYADPKQQHIGAIYQAGGWLYSGMSMAAPEYICNGKQLHGRSMRAKYGTTARARKALGAERFCIVMGSRKHRYLFPLDAAMRAQIEPLRQAYPKRATVDDGDSNRTVAVQLRPARSNHDAQAAT